MPTPPRSELFKKIEDLQRQHASLERRVTALEKARTPIRTEIPKKTEETETEAPSKRRR